MKVRGLGHAMLRTSAVAAVLSLAAALSAACSSSERSFVVGGGELDATTPGSGFEAPDSSSDAGATSAPPVGRCVATECVYPYGTCPNDDGALPTFKCGTDLANDPNNCGECGRVCDQGWAMVVVCSQGRCRNAGCADDYEDCDGIVDNGCEVFIREDDENCGACGTACAPGVRCLNGYCGGCPPGQVVCGNDGCVDLNTNDKHCGQCGFDCSLNQPDGGLAPPPPHMEYTCGDGTCGRLTCVGAWANCDGDLENGCEVDLRAPDPTFGLPFYDPTNCGGCGTVCAEGKLCFAFPPDKPPACHCDDGLTRCDNRCADLDNDPFNCGACDYHCPAPPAFASGAVASCVKGRCTTACSEGLSDCNQDPADGCEADLLRDPSNCGACGVRCDVGAGQPCVNGQCLTQSCEGPTR